MFITHPAEIIFAALRQDCLYASDHHISKTVSSCFSKLYQINRVKESFERKVHNQELIAEDFKKKLCPGIYQNLNSKKYTKLNETNKIVKNVKRRYITGNPLGGMDQQT